VERRDWGLPVTGPGRRARLIDPFADKVEEWVDRSRGHVRADVVHQRLVAVGFEGDERTTRRAVAEAKARWRAGHRRTYRPWITEPVGFQKSATYAEQQLYAARSYSLIKPPRIGWRVIRSSLRSATGWVGRGG